MKFKDSLLVILLSVTMLACEEANDVLTDPAGNDTPAEVSRITGEWSVFRYTDGNENETSSFRNITLQFDQNGEFHLKRSGQVIASGDWQLRDSNTELNIDVPVLAGENESLGEDLYELHDDWAVRLDDEGRMILSDEDEQFILIPQNN
jgi:hypothetical protein